MLSSIQLFASVMTTVLQAPFSMKLKIMKWVAITFSRGSYQPKDRTLVSCTASRFFTIWAIREAPVLLSNSQWFSEVVVSTSFPTTTMLLCMFMNKWFFFDVFRIYYFVSLMLGAFYFSLSISVSLSFSLKRFLRILVTIYTMLLDSVISSFSTAPWLFY